LLGDEAGDVGDFAAAGVGVGGLAAKVCDGGWLLPDRVTFDFRRPPGICDDDGP